MARLKEKYIKEIAPALMKKFQYKSVMQIPKIEKIVVNVGCGEARENAKVLDAVVGRYDPDHRPARRHHQGAKKSVANFKLREGMPVGAKVTLRGEKMWEFLDVCSTWLCPVSATSAASAQRIRRPRQLCLGIKEQLIFPEIEYDKIDKIRGMDIMICTTAQTDEEARAA
jgi:large subunit ribosomal protein L5